MDLETLDRTKAAALEALYSGEPHRAAALLAELEPVYARQGFVEGLLAVRFDALLAALEDGDRPGAGRWMSALANQLHEMEDGPLVREVARRLGRLFVEPVPGVDHRSSEALAAFAGPRRRRGGGPDPRGVGAAAPRGRAAARHGSGRDDAPRGEPAVAPGRASARRR